MGERQKCLPPGHSAVLVFAAAFLCFACGDSGDGGLDCEALAVQAEAADGVWPLFSLAREAAFGDHPFPSDVRQPAGAVVDLSDYPNPEGTGIVEETVRAVPETRRGAGLTAGATLVFNRALDVSGWPTLPADTITAESPIQLFELSGDGVRPIPLRWRYFATAGPYNRADTMRVVPDWGFALAPETRHVLALRGAPGIDRSPAMEQLLSGCTPDEELGATANDALASAISALEAAGFATSQWAYLQPFTTDEPLRATAEVLDKLLSVSVIPEITDLELVAAGPLNCKVKGRISLDQYQAGEPPFLAGGGNWVFDDDGSLVAQRTESVPVSFIFPHGAMPAQGWPLVVVVPGTNQTHEFLLESEFVEPMGMGTRGFAAAAKANPLHPDRDPSVNGFLTYNYEHPIAFRDNIRQSVVEQTLFLRALLGSTFSADLCPGSDTSAAEDGRLRFDESRVGATGQSLGSVILHNWAPLEPLLGAVAPTGAGGHYPLMLENPLGNSAVQTAAIIVRSLLGVAADALLDPLAPTAQVGQMALEPVDPVALASRIAQRPLPGVGAKHWYHPAGYIDSFFSPDSIRALVGPIAPALAGEEVDSSLFDLADLAALSVLPYPVTANVDTPDGPRTSVVVQYLAEDYDGHGVVYLDPRAQHQIGCFFETYFATGTPVVSAPRTALEPCSGP